MAQTNFAGLNSQQKLVWSRDVWSAARDQMFIKKFMGTSSSSMIQRITELTKTEKGEACVMQLVADLVTDGVIGDNEREGNEEELKNYEQIITIDMIGNGTRSKGKLADQKTVIKFREQSKDKLAYWLANRCDQLAFLTMSGISYAQQNNGAARINSQFSDLSFAADVSAPTAARHRNWTGTALTAGNTSAITASFLPTYKMIVQLRAYAKAHYVKPLTAGGKEYYVLLVSPQTLAALKEDDNYQRAVVTGMQRSEKNPWFTGATVMVDGVVIHEHNLVYNTTGRAADDLWGAGSNIEGTRSLLCGAQALGLSDLGPPEWDEQHFQYSSQKGIWVDKMFGLLKPKFHSIYDKATEDFGVIACDHYLPGGRTA